MNTNSCPICQQDIDVQLLGQIYTKVDSNQYSCRRCGTFAITSHAWYELQGLNDSKRPLLAAYTRHRSVRRLEVIMITTSNFNATSLPSHIPTIAIEDAISEFPQKISERLDRVLLNFKHMSTYTGSSFVVDSFHDAALLYTDSFKLDAAQYMLDILKEAKFIESNMVKFVISDKGWNRIYDLETQKNPVTNQVFIAMSFHPELNGIWKNSLERSIREAGYDPLRINEKETNGKIDDEIIAEIRRSKFIVADFTKQAAGVYFEAGFALGLGIPVIWTCSKQDIDDKKLHFDTRQYSHIAWESEDDLYTKLLNRIRATIV